MAGLNSGDMNHTHGMRKKCISYRNARGDEQEREDQRNYSICSLLFAARTNQKLQNRTLFHDRRQPANSGRSKDSDENRAKNVVG